MTAVAAAVLAAAVFASHSLLAASLIAISAWSLWSALIGIIHPLPAGSCLEDLVCRLYSNTAEINCAFYTAGLFPFTFLDLCHLPEKGANGRPVLMINGYLSFGATWYALKQRLMRSGIGPIYTLNVWSGGSIESYAQSIAEKVKQIQKETGKKEIDLIGHSRGGLIAAHYVANLAAGVEVKNAIAIGTPWTGSHIAPFGFGEDARQMRAGSPFLGALRDQVKTLTKTRFFHIASEQDRVVSLTSALLGEDTTRHFVLKDMGHLSLLFSSRVAHQITQWIKE